MSELGQKQLFSAHMILVCYVPVNGHYFQENKIGAFDVLCGWLPRCKDFSTA